MRFISLSILAALEMSVAAGWMRPLWSQDAPASTPGFANLAAEWGLTADAKRAVWGDLDGDGWLDAITDARRVWLNRPKPGGGRHLVEHTKASGLDARLSALGTDRPANFVVLGDVDADGDLDVFSGVTLELERTKPDPDDPDRQIPFRPDPGVRNAILLNDGTARFSELVGSGVEQPAYSSTCATFFDYDLDGVLDLFVGNWYRQYGSSYDAYADHLYRGRGDGTFEDVTRAAKLTTTDEAGDPTSSKPTYGVTTGDYDNDGDEDLFVCAYGRRWNLLWRNEGDGTFTEVGDETTFAGDDERSGVYPSARRAAEAPFRANGNTFDCRLADFDEDGDLDAFVAEITHAWAGPSSDRSSLLVNRGAEFGFSFQRVLDRGIERVHTGANWNQGDLYCGWIDVDGDGWLDLLLASGDYPDNQRLRLFRQRSDHGFKEATWALALDWEGSGAPTVGDVDRDGDPDLLIGRSLFRLSKEKRAELGGRPGLWINQAGDATTWITIRLRGRGPGGANTQGLGSRVVARTNEVVRHRVMTSSGGHSGHQDAAEIHLGLGGASKIDELRIEWANRARSVSVLKNLPVNYDYTIYEPAGDERPRIELIPHFGK